jgi:hypothetical protein
MKRRIDVEVNELLYERISPFSLSLYSAGLMLK